MQHIEIGVLWLFCFFQEIENRQQENKENNKNFQQFLIYNTWLYWSILMNKVSFWSLENALTE